MRDRANDGRLGRYALEQWVPARELAREDVGGAERGEERILPVVNGGRRRWGGIRGVGR